jgi:hypothetical protein
MTSSPSPRAVDVLVRAAAATAERELAEPRPRPPFAGVVARAHRIDPAQVPARWLGGAHTVDDEPVAPRRRLGGYLLAAAAAALLALGVQRGLQGRRLADDADGFQAGASGRDDAPAALAPHDPTPTASPAADLPTAPPNIHTPTASTDPPNTPTPTTLPTTPAPPRESLDDLLRRLDDEAEARMQVGDLAGADERYAEIVRRGGRRVQVELAFADRFHLARQRGDRAALHRLWAAYLARFPRGQFADDARAGQCRDAAPDERPACWRRYTDDFPRGSYAAEAAAEAP